MKTIRASLTRMDRRRRKLTPEHDEYIVREIKQGTGPCDIARALNVGSTTIYEAAERLGVWVPKQRGGGGR